MLGWGALGSLWGCLRLSQQLQGQVAVTLMSHKARLSNRRVLGDFPVAVPPAPPCFPCLLIHRVGKALAGAPCRACEHVSGQTTAPIRP